MSWTRRAHTLSTSARNRMWSSSRTCCSVCKAAGRSWCSALLREAVCWTTPGRGPNRYCVMVAYVHTILYRQMSHVGNILPPLRFLLSLESSGNSILSLCYIFCSGPIKAFSLVWVYPVPWTRKLIHVNINIDWAINQVKSYLSQNA